MVAGVTPNHSTAAGTHATDGRLCSPDSSGPMAARTTRTFATSSPSGVATATPITNPITARETEVHTYPSAAPLVTWSRSSPQTASGAGSLNSGQNAAAHSTCHTA